MTRVVLITGCDEGIGRRAARAFAEADWTVYATGLDAEALEPLEADGCETVVLDVTDEDVGSVVDDIAEEAGRLDCLVNNAGVGHVGAVEETDAEDVSELFEVNVVGMHRVTKAALPYLRDSEIGRVVNLSSVVGRYPLPGMAAYTASKFAVEGWTEALRGELEPFDVDAILVEPGVVGTGFVDDVFSDLDARVAEGGRYAELYGMLDYWLPDLADLGGDADETATTIVRAASAPKPRERYPVGMQGRVLVLGGYLPPWARDAGWRVARNVSRVFGK
ncbi:SDR family oxidoreductase [Haloprofundus halobius]|uniref:SDR family oxidoreductase n=1 Tax=Haloprofundus halobius TaxID=2876194 RepID=UPI001CC900DE|nr:SDR family oxidoreductase [Haloprofundus halobius]